MKKKRFPLSQLIDIKKQLSSLPHPLRVERRGQRAGSGL